VQQRVTGTVEQRRFLQVQTLRPRTKRKGAIHMTREMPLSETINRITSLIKQHDRLKRTSLRALETGNQFISIFDLDGGYTYGKYEKLAQAWLNLAKWVQRATRMYVIHFEYLTKDVPEKVKFT
jgi:hypothetical protein